MHIELWELSGIRPYDKKPRVNDQAAKTIMAAIAEFGFRQSVRAPGAVA